MYATAHRVRSSEGATGINSFLHEHGEEGRGIDWSAVSISQIVDYEPGALVAQATEVAPGRNAVLSFLDVVAPDGTSVAAIESALKLEMGALLSGMLPTEARLQTVSLRFGAIFGLREAAQLEYAELAERVVMVVRDRPTPPWRGKDPIDLVATPHGDGITLSLTEDSRDRLRRKGGLRAAPRSVSLDGDVRDAFQQMHGDVLLHLVPLLTGLSLEDLANIGGVRVRMSGSEAVVWAWPKG